MSADLLISGSSQSWLDAWRWKVGAEAHLIAASVCGDLFLRGTDHRIVWVDTGAGSIESVADSENDFLRKLHSPEFCEAVLLRTVAEAFLLASGPLPADTCLGYRTLPVFGGDYSGENRIAMSCQDHFGVTGHLHQNIEHLPKGEAIKLAVTNTDS
jgi:hypothetical protein